MKILLRQISPFFLAVASVSLLIFGSAFVFANGGDQRVVDEKYLINLSRSPFTPKVGVKTALLASFVGIETNKLIAEDLQVDIRIAKLGGSGGKRTFVFEENDVEVKGGVLEFSYTFEEAGLHEIFFDFAFASSPDEVYAAPDFLLDVQDSATTSGVSRFVGLFMIGSIFAFFLGFLCGLFVRSKKPKA